MKNWIAKLSLLLLLPAMLAFADSRVRTFTIEAKAPVQKQESKQTASATGEQPAADAGIREKEEVDWVHQKFQETQNTIFIDARPHDQFAEGHIPGAYNIAFGDFFAGKPEILDYLPQDYLLIVYCEGGDCDASHKVEEMLHEYGFKNTKVFEAGLPAWQAAGLPIEVPDTSQ